MQQILVPIFICVVLPVAIVGIIYYASINRTNKRAQILLKALELNNQIDSDKLTEALQDPRRKSARDILNTRLLRGFIYTLIGLVLIVTELVSSWTDEFGIVVGGIIMAIGISYLAVYLITRKEVKG
ncbi:MAG: hypothetical protein K2H86_05310 [Muribaculaceae bacterium]|nr:hypothetical protein [Muribaculaceae bacterium]